MRRLYNIPIEQIEDPTLALLFRDKREELAKMLGMLRDRGTGKFVYSSMQVYGGVEDAVLEIAHSLLTLTAGEEPATGTGATVTAAGLQAARRRRTRLPARTISRSRQPGRYPRRRNGLDHALQR